jgi:hypothetical protein
MKKKSIKRINKKSIKRISKKSIKRISKKSIKRINKKSIKRKTKIDGINFIHSLKQELEELEEYKEDLIELIKIFGELSNSDVKEFIEEAENMTSLEEVKKNIKEFHNEIQKLINNKSDKKENKKKKEKEKVDDSMFGASEKFNFLSWHEKKVYDPTIKTTIGQDVIKFNEVGSPIVTGKPYIEASNSIHEAHIEVN